MKYDNELYVQHLQGMTRIPTVSNVDPEKLPVEEFLKLHQYLEQAYPLVHKHLEKEVVGKAALVFHWKGSGTSDKLPVLLCGHQDVVPEGDWNAWKYPPFSGHVDEEGIMWGRGCKDCKSTMQAELDAVEGLLAEGYTPDFDVYMAFGYNEEIMGGPGAACQYVHDLFAERGLRFGLVIDEGGSGVMNSGEPTTAMVYASEKGYADYEFSVEDGGGHAAMPPVHNALGKLGMAMYTLEENPMEPYLSDAVVAMFKAQAPSMPEPLCTLLADPEAHWEEIKAIYAADRSKNTYVRTTTTPTMAQGSGQANILPEKATVITNSRLLPGQTLHDLEEHFRKVLPEEVHFRLLKGHNPPAVSSTESMGWKVLVKVLEDMHPGVKVIPACLYGGTDSRYYCDLSDSVYRFVGGKGSANTGGVHAVNEHIDTATLASNVEYFVRLIRAYNEA